MDDLEEMLDLRAEFEEKGLTFYIHVDAAWGGYFASVLRSKEGKHLNAVYSQTLYKSNIKNSLFNSKKRTLTVFKKEKIFLKFHQIKQKTHEQSAIVHTEKCDFLFEHQEKNVVLKIYRIYEV